MSHTHTTRPTTAAAPATTTMTEPIRNLAETLADVLPEAQLLDTGTTADRMFHVALPKGYELKTLDFEKLLPAPRRAQLTVSTDQTDSFTAYVARHAGASTVVWCNFDPQTFALDFTAVFDDFAEKQAPGWRGHRAGYKPEPSAEWKAWTASNGSSKAMGQLDFASFLERNETDIAAVDGMPTSAQMMSMATAFEANSEKRVKSVVKLQGGGMRLDFVDDNDAETEAQMKVFEKFAIGIPVLWAGPGYRIDARLKYRHGSGKVNFWYELIRADRVHEAAAHDLIEKIRSALPAGVPMFMGNAKA